MKGDLNAILKLSNTFTFHPAAQQSKYNNAHLSAIAFLTTKIHPTTQSHPRVDYRPFYQICLYMTVDRRPLQPHPLKPAEETSLIRNTIERLTMLGDPSSIKRAMLLQESCGAFLLTSRQAEIDWLLRVCSLLDFRKEWREEALPVVKMVIQQFEELQAQISFQNPLWGSLNHLLREVQATTLRALKEGEPCFENEIECTLFEKGLFQLHAPPAQAMIHSTGLNFNKHTEEWAPLLSAWNQVRLQKIPLKQTYTKQELEGIRTCLQDATRVYTTMKAFPSPSLYPIARDFWIQVYTQLLEIPQFLPTRWLGTGAELGCFHSDYILYIKQLEKGMDRALLRESSFLERNTEVMILAYMLLVQSHGFFPATEQEKALHRALVEKFLTKVNKVDQLALHSITRDRRIPSDILKRVEHRLSQLQNTPS